MLAVVACALSACATTGVNRGDVNLMSIEEEWALGRRLEADLAKKLTLVEDRAVLGYVRRLGRKLVQETEMAKLPWSFHVVEDPEINAFNIPGGHIYVNTGLIAAADNASELAGVMGHEVAHGVARHATEQLTKVYGLNLLAGVLLGQDPRAYESILAQILSTGAVASFSRDAEEEADLLAVRFLYDAGYDPEGLPSLFEELLTRRRRSQGSVGRFFATHPQTESRIRNTRAAIAELPPRPGLITDEPGFRRARSRVR
ncbi:MAG: M48 family metallopeptidase [Thermoanaerobaculia bacterium]|nr:M48 family metallopeptidase [Thermoanaerobaculia bacterium]